MIPIRFRQVKNKTAPFRLRQKRRLIFYLPKPNWRKRKGFEMGWKISEIYAFVSSKPEYQIDPI